MRLRRLEAEFGGAVRVDWRSFLLRTRPDPSRTLEQFRAYTQSWMRAAAEPDAGVFRVWVGAAGPPSHSLPPHVVAKAAQTFDSEAFRRMHERLLHAYFAESRDVTDAETLATLWTETGLPAEGLTRLADPALLRQVVDEHNEAVRLGVTGVPALRVAGDDAVVMGAHPLSLYRRWIERLLARES